MQGPTCYTTYASVFTQSNAGGVCPSFPGTSVSEISTYGVPLNRIVVGKPLLPSDAGSGYTPPADLHNWYITAHSTLGWNAGYMTWTWSAASGPAWYQTVFSGLPFP